MRLTYRSHYFHDPEARAAFIRFLVEIHGLDLTPWDEEGLWDHDFVPFSFFEGDRVIASTCVYSLPMCVQKRECRVAQISSVGTLPAFRRRGLNRELTTRARQWIAEQDHLFTFLFADEEALPFYHACGFEHAPQHRFTCTPPAVPLASRAPVTLDLSSPDHRRLLERVARTRTPVSHLLGHRSFGLQMFHALYLLRGLLFYLEEFDLIVAARRHGDAVVFYDLVGSELPAFDQLQPYFQGSEITGFEFGFVPDRLGVSYDCRLDDGADGTHVDESFPLKGIPFRFPATAHA